MDLEGLFNPESIAVIGASAREGSVGYIYLDSILRGGYQGRVFPVNPKYESIQGVRCYDSIASVGKVDLAVIATNKLASLEVLRECAEVGVRSAVIPTGGFEEVDEAGAELEEEIRRLASDEDIALLGTNTLGLINNHTHLQVTFNPRALPPAGGVSIITQSGGMGLSIISKLREEGVGMSKWVGVGNRTLLDFPEIMAYLGQDESTSAVGVFMEGTERAGELCRVAGAIVDRKPIVVYKMGRSRRVDYLAITHTGTGVGEMSTYKGAFRQHGIQWTESVREMVARLKALVMVPEVRGKGLGVFTYTAGPTIAAADLIGGRLDLNQPSRETLDRVRGLMRGEPPTILKNPLDVDGEGYTSEQYGALLRAFAEDKSYDLLATVSTAGLLFPSEELARVRAEVGKPILHCHISDVLEVSGKDREVLQNQGVPVYTTPEELAAGLIALSEQIDVRARRRSEVASPILVDASPFDHEILDEYETESLLSEAGFPVVPGRTVGTFADLTAFVDQVGFPVVLKLLSREVLHKTEAGAVWLRIMDHATLRDSWNELRGRWPETQALVQKMVEGGVELILGRKRDPAFGDVVSLGLGGFLADLHPPVIAMCPCSKEQCREMVDRFEPRAILDGYRGREPVDREALAGLIERLSRLELEDGEEILEMDLNPVIARGDRLIIVDAVMRKG